MNITVGRLYTLIENDIDTYIIHSADNDLSDYDNKSYYLSECAKEIKRKNKDRELGYHDYDTFVDIHHDELMEIYNLEDYVCNFDDFTYYVWSNMERVLLYKEDFYQLNLKNIDYNDEDDFFDT